MKPCRFIIRYCHFYKDILCLLRFLLPFVALCISFMTENIILLPVIRFPNNFFRSDPDPTSRVDTDPDPYRTFRVVCNPDLE